MKYFKFSVLRIIVLITLLTGSFSCVKKDNFFGPDNNTSTRKSIVRIKDAENSITSKARDVSPTIDQFVLIELRRDANDESDLNQPLTVSLVKNAALITSYNTANGTSYVELPSSSYQLLTDISNITFQPGEAVKEIQIKLDKSTLSLSTQYALGFSIATVGANGTISSAYKDAVYAIGIKNKYDGHYRVTGTMIDYANASLTGYYPWEVDLRTSGPNQVIVYDRDVTGGIDHLILNGGSLSRYGSFGVVFNFDANNNVISVVNYYGQPAGNGRSAELDPSGINKWDPSTKTLRVKYWMNQPSVITPHRVSFDETYTYIGPR